MKLIREEGGLRFEIANNGRPPKGPIHESGGLLTLRRKVEDAGGRVRVETTPDFRLIVEVM